MNKWTLILLIVFTAPTFANGDGGIVSQMVNTNSAAQSDVNEATEQPIQDLTTAQSNDIESGLDRTDVPMQIESLNAQQETFDTSDPTANTMIVPYNPTVTYKLAVREVMGTTIVLPEGEGIESHRLGDDMYWSINTVGTDTDAELPRIASVQVLMPGTDTSLTIVGSSGNIYTFYLRGYTWRATVDPILTFYIQDDRLQTKIEAAKRREQAQEKAERERIANIEEEKRQRRLEKEKNDYLREASVNPEDYNFDYKLEGGDEALAPYYVYDDGIFTYFKFDSDSAQSKNRPMPVVYKVIDGSDSPTNTTPVGDNLRILRVEGVNNSWTLRMGEKYLCVKRRTPIPSPATNMNSTVGNDS